MTTIAFAIPPPSLLPESLQRAMLNTDLVEQSAQKPPTPDEGMSLPWASQSENNAPKAPLRAEPTLEQPEEDVLEVQLSTPATPQIESMTVKQLKAYAAEIGVSLQGLTAKKQMLQKLRMEL